MTSQPDKTKPADDVHKAVRFLLVKAAIFIGIPLAAAITAVLVMMP